MSGMKINRYTKSHMWLVLFVASCFLFTTDVGAQVVPSELEPSQQVVKDPIPVFDYYPGLVNASTAEAMLLAEIAIQQQQLDQLTPNTAAYELAERKLALYMHAWEGISTGEGVEASLTSAYGEFALTTTGVSADSDELPALPSTSYGDPAFDSLVTFLEQ